MLLFEPKIPPEFVLLLLEEPKRPPVAGLAPKRPPPVFDAVLVFEAPKPVFPELPKRPPVDADLPKPPPELEPNIAI